MVLLDTSVAIELQEQGIDFDVIARFTGEPALSIFTLIELEGGIHAHADYTELRRRRLQVILRTIVVLPFDIRVIATYGKIVSALGFSRRQILDRLIAATAIVHGLTLVTANERDFADVPGLKLEVWPAQ